MTSEVCAKSDQQLATGRYCVLLVITEILHGYISVVEYFSFKSLKLNDLYTVLLPTTSYCYYLQCPTATSTTSKRIVKDTIHIL